MSKKIYIIAVILFLVTGGVSYVLFSQLAPKTIIQAPPPTKSANGGTQFDATLPKTESCPINGVMYSVQQRQWWEKHEPLIVMIENSTDARPQSGLSSADIVYEAIAEGGITRFAAVFYCQDAAILAPIRSARTYFIDFASEYGPFPLYTHVGGANAAGPANALGQLDDYGWSGHNDLNQFSIGYPVFVRDYNRLDHTVATEHTMETSTSKLWDYAKQNRQITNVDSTGTEWNTKFVKYTFKDDAPAAARPASQNVHLEFWPGGTDYSVDWAYDSANNVYKRSNGGQPHLDLNTKKQLTAKNVVILWMQEDNAQDGYANNEHLLYQDLGTGKATIFMDGKQILGTWKKATRTSRTLLYDAQGNPIQFNRGNIWFTVLPLTGVLTVK